MADLKIVWNKHTPLEMRALIEPIIDEYKWLLPQWMVTLYVGYWDSASQDATGTTTHAEICVNDDYLNASLSVFSSWMDGDQETRRNDIVHEFLHAYFNPIFDFCGRLLNTWKEEDRGPMWRMLNQERTNYLERSVTALAWTLIQSENRSRPSAEILDGNASGHGSAKRPPQ